MKFFTAVLLLSTSALAARHDPMPDSVNAAKSVFIVNQTGYQSVSDTAYDQFTRWGRFTVAPTEEDADLLAVFRLDSGLRRGDSLPFIQMDVVAKASGSSAYQTTARWTVFRNATKSCVRDFRRRFGSN